VDNSLWKRLWTCRGAEYGMNETRLVASSVSYSLGWWCVRVARIVTWLEAARQKCLLFDDVIRCFLSTTEARVNTWKVSKQPWHECVDCESVYSGGGGGRNVTNGEDIKAKAEFFWSARRKRQRILRIPLWLFSGERNLHATHSYQLLILFAARYLRWASCLYSGWYRQEDKE
jgi:hypothetical protein